MSQITGFKRGCSLKYLIAWNEGVEINNVFHRTLPVFKFEGLTVLIVENTSAS